jgi:hypothetical protein
MLNILEREGTMSTSAYTVKVNSEGRQFEYVTVAQHGADAITAAIERFGLCAVSVVRMTALEQPHTLAA